jgi:hypothetical protein
MGTNLWCARVPGQFKNSLAYLQFLNMYIVFFLYYVEKSNSSNAFIGPFI